MRWSVERKLAVGFALAGATVVLAAVVIWDHSVLHQKTTQWVAHTRQELAGLQTALALMTDAETGMRGFLLTGQELYLEPYRPAARRYRFNQT